MLLLSGWLIVLASLVMLTAFKERFAFVVAGLAIEALGLGLLLFGNRAVQEGKA